MAALEELGGVPERLDEELVRALKDSATFGGGRVKPGLRRLLGALRSRPRILLKDLPHAEAPGTVRLVLGPGLVLDLGNHAADEFAPLVLPVVSPARQRGEDDLLFLREVPLVDGLATPPAGLVLGGPVIPGADEARAFGQGVDAVGAGPFRAPACKSLLDAVTQQVPQPPDPPHRSPGTTHDLAR